MSEEYEVGYKRPPEHSKFKKGKSGNPKGRPKGSKSLNMAQGLKRMLLRKVPIIENGEKVMITMIEALERRLLTDAANGKQYAMKMTLALVEKLDLDVAERVDVPVHLCPNKCMSKVMYELAEKGPEPLPGARSPEQIALRARSSTPVPSSNN